MVQSSVRLQLHSKPAIPTNVISYGTLLLLLITTRPMYNSPLQDCYSVTCAFTCITIHNRSAIIMREYTYSTTYVTIIGAYVVLYIYPHNNSLMENGHRTDQQAIAPFLLKAPHITALRQFVWSSEASSRLCTKNLASHTHSAICSSLHNDENTTHDIPSVSLCYTAMYVTGYIYIYPVTYMSNLFLNWFVLQQTLEIKSTYRDLNQVLHPFQIWCAQTHAAQKS